MCSWDKNLSQKSSFQDIVEDKLGIIVGAGLF